MLSGQAEGDRFRRALADRARREVIRQRTEWMIDCAMSSLEPATPVVREVCGARSGARRLDYFTV